MAFYAFTSADSGAPTLNGVNGSWINVLDWIVVTKGGGTKVYSGTNKAIYQLAGGGMYLRIVHDSAVSSAANLATVRSCEGATGVDTYTDPCPTVAQRADTVSVWAASSTANSTARTYRGVITDNILIIVVQYASTEAAVLYIFGKGDPVISSDPYCSLIVVGQSTNGGLFNAGNINDCKYFQRDITGTVKSSKAGFMNPQSGYFAAGAYPAGLSNITAIHPYNSKIHHRAPPMACLGSASATSSMNQGSSAMVPRCYIPQLRDIMVGTSTFANGDVLADSSYDAGAAFVVATNSNASSILIETTDTWKRG